MLVLLLTGILAFGANSVISQKQVLAKGWCSSTLNRVTGSYSTLRCQVPNAPTDQRLHLTVLHTRYPFTCIQGNYDLITSSGRVYIRVRNGCSAYFVVAIEAGTWGDWSGWSSCSKECRSTRSRTCNTGKDEDCIGDANESKICSTGECETKVSNLDECGLANSASGFRVVNGRTAGKCEFPWMVFVYNQVKRSMCGGSILDDRHILTAAHCVENKETSTVYPASNFIIFSGSSQISSSSSTIRRHSAKEIKPHAGYVFTQYQIKDDIAVIRLSNSLKFDQCHRPLCLSNGSRSVQNGKNCRVMGWGRTSNDQSIETPQDLQWISETAVSKNRCYSEYRNLVSDKVFCAKGENAGACNGDSGGPFTCQHEDGKFYQYGIVSAGKSKACGERYTLYVNVHKYLDWIYGAITS